MQLFDFYLSAQLCSAIFREALKKAYDELTKNGCAIDVGSFLEFMLEYKPLMRELNNEWYILQLVRCEDIQFLVV